MKKSQKKMENFFQEIIILKFSEGLNRYFNVEYIVRKSKIEESHELN